MLKYFRKQYNKNLFKIDLVHKLPPLEGNLEVITRMEAAMLLEASSEDFKYEIWEKPTIEKYTIDGEKASSFSYRKISNYDRDSFFCPKVVYFLNWL